MTLHDFGGGFSDRDVVVGRAPVWTLGLGTGSLHLPPVSGTEARLPSLKIMWIVGPNKTQPVVARGHEGSTGDPLWFQVYPANATPELPSSYTTRLVLDPESPNRGYARNGSGQWSIWGIGVGVQSAGCYSMTVSSSTGSWTVQLAVGG